jgi:hypothetical protein
MRLSRQLVATLTLYLSDKAVSPSRESFDIAGVFRRVAQNVSQFVDSSIQSVVEIDKRVARPQPGSQFLASKELARSAQKDGKNLKGLPDEPHLD